MTKPVAKEPHELGGEDWTGEMGERWLANLDRFEGMIEPIGTALLDRANFRPGERVVDIGPGGGATTRAIARAVAPNGEVVGVDVAPMLVAEARRRTEAESIDNARFVCADAGTVRLDDAPFDRLFSRFGSMFFEAPVPAFTNLHAMLRPNGQVDLAVWGPPRDNLWMMEMMGVVRRHVEVPPAVPRAPGPFALEDLDYLNEILTKSGISDVDIAAYEGKLAIGGRGTSPVDAVAFVLSSLGVGRIVEDVEPDIRGRTSADLLSLFENHFVEGDGIMMIGKAWLVTAKA